MKSGASIADPQIMGMVARIVRLKNIVMVMEVTNVSGVVQLITGTVAHIARQKNTKNNTLFSG